MLSAEELTRFRRRLLDRQSELRAGLQSLRERSANEGFNALAGEAPDLEDAATAEQLQDENRAEINRDVHELREVELALGRVEAGGYGVCQRCGRQIELARLEAMPTARYDLEHQSEAEAHPRQPIS
jgi:RNA polymerase-binding transcription factor